MAYSKTNWVDRAVENPRTYRMQNNPDGTVTLIPEPGVVYEPGTPVNAPNLNKIEQGIADAETPAGAQAKANAAETNAKNWAMGFGLGASAPYIANLNSLPINSGTGFYTTTGNTSNTPPGVGNGSVIHIARDSRPSQIFTDYSTNRMFIRGYTGSTWNSWVEIWTGSNFNPNTKAGFSGNKVLAEGAWAGLLANATGNTNPEVELSHEGVRRGLINAESGSVQIRKYGTNGSIESRLHVTSNGATINGNEAWHAGNNTASTATNGYQRLASGIIIQWGVVSFGVGTAAVGFSFPIAFPNNPRNVQATGQSVGGATFTVGFEALSSTGVTVRRSGSATDSASAHWIAIGY